MEVIRFDGNSPYAPEAYAFARELITDRDRPGSSEALERIMSEILGQEHSLERMAYLLSALSDLSDIFLSTLAKRTGRDKAELRQEIWTWMAGEAKFGGEAKGLQEDV